MKDVLSVLGFGIGGLCFAAFSTVCRPNAVSAISGTA
jgi:hypothetical protein